MAKLAYLAIALALVFVGTTSAALAADDKVDLTGTWLVEIEIAGQTGAPQFELKQEGTKLTGKYTGQFGSADVKGKVDEDELEIKFDLEDGSTIVYTGTIEKDGTLKGKADYAGQAEGTWTAKRKKAE